MVANRDMMFLSIDENPITSAIGCTGADDIDDGICGMTAAGNTGSVGDSEASPAMVALSYDCTGGWLPNPAAPDAKSLTTPPLSSKDRLTLAT